MHLRQRKILPPGNYEIVIASREELIDLKIHSWNIFRMVVNGNTILFVLKEIYDNAKEKAKPTDPNS